MKDKPSTFLKPKEAVPQKRYPFEPDWAIAPGEMVKDEMEARGWSLLHTSQLLGWTPLGLEEVLRGELPITGKMATTLAATFGTSASLWENLEANYRKHLSKVPTVAERIKARLEEFTEALESGAPAGIKLKRHVGTFREADDGRWMHHFDDGSSVEAHVQVAQDGLEAPLIVEKR